MIRKPLNALACSLVLVMVPVSSAMADGPACREVKGHQTEYPIVEGCASPVGLCTGSDLQGALRGTQSFTASEFLTSVNTPDTNLVFVAGDIVMEAKLGSKRGTLYLKNHAAYNLVTGDLVDIQVIVGGTGDFAGATGQLRISGTFLGDSGEASYEGTLCTP